MPSKWSTSSADYLTPRAPGQSDSWTSAAPGRTAQRLTRTGKTEAPLAVAHALRIDSGAEVYIRERAIQLDGEVIEIASSYYPAAVAEGTALAEPGRIKGGAVSELARLGYEAAHVTEDVELRAASDGEAGALGVAAGVNIISLLRTTYAHSNTPFEASLMVMKGPRRLHYEMEVTP